VIHTNTTCICMRMYIDAVAGNVMLYLHDFYNTIFKIKQIILVCWCLATRAAQERPFRYIPRKLRDPWRQGTFHVRS
jgi:hypothetical protein